MVVKVDMHRWFAVVYDGDEVVCVIGSSDGDGLIQFESVEEYLAAYS